MITISLDDDIVTELKEELKLASLADIDIALEYNYIKQDDSFDHEFGTERRYSYHSQPWQLYLEYNKRMSNFPVDNLSKNLQHKLKEISQEHLDKLTLGDRDYDA